MSSPNPAKYSNITVNYTISGVHTLDEGFVMRYAEKGSDGKTIIKTYGEGNAWKQKFPGASWIAGREWSKVNSEIENNTK